MILVSQSIRDTDLRYIHVGNALHFVVRVDLWLVVREQADSPWQTMLWGVM